jgi:hypothetical protein
MLRGLDRPLQQPAYVPQGSVELCIGALVSELTSAEVEQDYHKEEDVHDGRGSGIEVVVSCCDELAHFVNEEPNASARQHRTGGEDPPVGKDQRCYCRGKKQEPTPENMSNVNLT